MRKNIHKNERAVRVMGGVALTSMAFIGPANPLFLIGLVPLVTGLAGTCPVYSGLKLSTNPSDKPVSEKDKYFHHPVSPNV